MEILVEDSNRLRGIAIISVMFAHVLLHEYNIYTEFIELIGVIGVPIFYFLSGIALSLNKEPFKIFFLKKVNRILLPWFIAAIILYSITSFGGVENSKLSLYGFFKFFVGYKSIYYFLSNLMIFYIIFYRHSYSIIYLTLLFMINLISIYLTSKYSYNLMYLNPLNFIFFFSFGLYFHKHLHQFFEYKNLFYISFILEIILIFLNVVINSYSYFSVLRYFFMLNSIIILIYFRKKNRVIYSLGEFSFSIYLYHLPILGFLNFLFPNEFFAIFKVSITLLVLYYLFYYIKRKGYKIKMLIGLR